MAEGWIACQIERWFLVDIRNMADGWIDSFVVRYRSRRSIDSFAYGMKGTQLDIYVAL